MILDQTAVENMAQLAANMSGKPQRIYQRRNGELFFGPEGTLTVLRDDYNIQDARLIKEIQPKAPDEKL